jgi:hypothetical protein
MTDNLSLRHRCVVKEVRKGEMLAKGEREEENCGNTEG